MAIENGIQLPPGLLPSVQTLKPGYGLIYKAPQMDKRLLDYYLETFHQRCRDYESINTLIKVTFHEQDLSGPRGELQTFLTKLLDEMDGKSIDFVISPFFYPRHEELQKCFLHVFQFHTVGPKQAIVVPLKINGERFGPPSGCYDYPHVVAVRMPDAEKPKRRVFTIELDPDDPNPETTIAHILEEYKKRFTVKEKQA